MRLRSASPQSDTHYLTPSHRTTDAFRLDDLPVRRVTPAFLTMIMLLVVGGLVVLYVGKRLLAKPEAPAAGPPDRSDGDPGPAGRHGHHVGAPRQGADPARSKLVPENACDQ